MVTNLDAMLIFCHAKILQTEYAEEQAIQQKLAEVKLGSTHSKSQLKKQSLFEILFDTTTQQPKSVKNLNTKAEFKNQSLGLLGNLNAITFTEDDGRRNLEMMASLKMNKNFKIMNLVP